MTRSTTQGTVYRLFDAAGQLLYVGCTMNGASRLGSHRDKPWWTQVASASFEHFSSYAEASRAEYAAIEAERPRHTKDHPPPVTDAQMRKRVETRQRTRERRARQYIAGASCRNCGSRRVIFELGTSVEDHECGACGLRELVRDKDRIA